MDRYGVCRISSFASFIVYKKKEGMVEMKHLLKIIMVMVLAGSISGCSELEEIEERGFVVGAAYDIVKKRNQIRL